MKMCHSLLARASLYTLLLHVDEDLADEARRGGCPFDGGRLHRGDFERKPRGALGPLGRRARTRFSFCCANRECRKRVTPASVRFLGRRVYLGAAVVLLSTMRHGGTAKRQARLHELFGVSPRTVQRWRRWWRETFAKTRCWKETRGHLRVPVDAVALPDALLACFVGDELDRLRGVLRALRPLSTTSGGKAGSSMAR
jgi:hypothetical protein